MSLDDAHLLDMSIAAKDAREFVNSLTKEKFENSRLHQYAILKAVEIVAEAASKVSEETRTKYPSIPWSEISSWYCGLRADTSVANSAEIHLRILWHTASASLPKLIEQLEPLIPPGPE